ncbi:MAG TPA: DapH/DapD/GlmU-related protein [Candidatus Binatia bacterium]|nr:DapH/DapD/GlmU-related protein [Candidatus Binatia bacterium]
MTFLTDVQKRLEALLQPNSEYEEFLTAIKNANSPWEIVGILGSTFAIRETAIKGTLNKSCDFEGKMYVGEGTVIKKSTLEGPIYIGKNCRIGPDAYVRPYTIIGDNCHIGHGTEMKNAIILSHSNAAHRNFIADSIVGEHCNLGNKTGLPNLRLDEKVIIPRNGNNEKEPYTRRKYGAIIEDGCKFACGIDLIPGQYVTGYQEAYRDPKETVFRSRKIEVKTH